MRIASQRLRNADMASLLAGGREVLWGSNLCWHSMSHMGSALCQWRLLPGGLYHGRLCNTDVTSLMEEEHCGGAIFFWHRKTFMGSVMCQRRLLPDAERGWRESKDSFTEGRCDLSRAW